MNANLSGIFAGLYYSDLQIESVVDESLEDLNRGVSVFGTRLRLDPIA